MAAGLIAELSKITVAAFGRRPLDSNAVAGNDAAAGRQVAVKVGIATGRATVEQCRVAQVCSR